MRIFSKDTFKIISIPILVASLCCLSPVILVLFGLSTVTFAGSLADTLYGSYKWLFRIVGLLLLTVSIIFYLRRQKGICALNEAKRRRNEILNIVGIALTVGIVGYFLWLYVVVEYIGKLLNIWS